MEKVLLITEALEYIENNLTDEIKTEDIAKELYCSKSSIEKLFRIVTNLSIKDYTIRRRMSRAAKDILNNPDTPLLEYAVKYGYGSNEAFSRAFKGIWHVNPSEYRKNPSRFELFPALKLDADLLEDEVMKNKKMVDISELYDYIRERKNCYVVCVDINNLIPINDISFEAGDLAIITALKRMEMASGEEDIVFRIGGDEFALISNSTEKEYVDKIVNEILSHNGECIELNGQQIPLNLYATSYKMEFGALRYADLYTKMHHELDLVKAEKN